MIAAYGMPPAAPPAFKIEPNPIASFDFCYLASDVAVAWYYLHALAATLALVPRERIAWAVKWNGLYLIDRVWRGEEVDSRFSGKQSKALLFASRADAEHARDGDEQERVVRLRLRARAGRGEAK